MIWKTRVSTLALIFSVILASYSSAEDASINDPQLRWWKGNIHTHTLWSDGNDFPEMIANWYRTHDYNFLALSDHNILSEGEKWMPVATALKRGGNDVIKKYQAQFGTDWVETRGEPGTPKHEIRLQPLNEFRSLLEEREKFIMVQGEEISDRFSSKPIHMNATNIKQVLQPVGGESVVEAIRNNFRAVEEQAEKAGREIMLHLNHPNFGYGVTAEEIAEVVSERFFEVYNGHPGIRHLGDDDHPSIERLWDIANTIRIAHLNSAPLYGVGTDDSHHYHGRGSSRNGRGWIMVHSKYLSPNHLLRAINRGDFYASSGVTLDEISLDEQSQTLSFKILAEEGVTYKTQFVGTLLDYDQTATVRTGKDGKPLAIAKKYSEDVGKVLAEVDGLDPSYHLTGKELYVRAVVTSSKDHRDPSFKDQHQQAWIQPVGWEKHLGDKE
ncbi:MAG: PHP domain-containing protein [Pirellulales bacterium]